MPCIVADDLTDAQIQAFRLADNKVGEKSEWDYDLLSEEMEDLLNMDFDMTVFGFQLDEPVEEEAVEEDEFDEELPEEPKSKPGEIYQLGSHRLMCGDSTSESDVESLMDGNEADMVLTDPPYNVNISNSKGMTIQNDNMDSPQFLDFLTEAFANIYNSLKPGGVFYIWFASREYVNFEKALNNNNLLVRQELIWISRQDYQWKHGPCLYGWKDGAAHYFIDDRTQTTVIEDQKPNIKHMKKEEMAKLLEEIFSDKLSTTVINEDKPSNNDLHPTMKPLKLMGRQIANSSRKGESVLDLFGGSGSTLMACEQLGRRCYTMEYDPINNSIRIARTEGHRIQNQAALDAQHKAQAKGADIVKQWDSTLDGKTRPTHRLLDGQLRELDDDFELQGNKASAPGQFNDPAEDCNCRCALLQRARWALGESELETLREKASFHGLRVDDSKEYGHEKAKDFSDYFSKYMVATKSEEGADSGSVRDEARKINGKVRNAEELQAAAENIKLNIDNCSNNASLWSGRINVDNKRLDGMNASGCKEWNCDITLKDTSTDATIQHELLHSCSVSYYDEDVFRENQKIEEASVEFLNKQICKERKMESDGTYSELVMILEAINKACNFGTDMEFAKELFNQPLPERYEWLEAKVIRWLMESNATATDADEVIKFIGRLADNETE